LLYPSELRAHMGLRVTVRTSKVKEKKWICTADCRKKT
jgi:hypothetical protein